jgi:hypothetical protein
VTAAVSIQCNGPNSCAMGTFNAITGGTDTSIVCAGASSCYRTPDFSVDARQTTGSVTVQCSGSNSCQDGTVSILAGTGTAALECSGTSACIASTPLLFDASDASSFTCTDCNASSVSLDVYSPGALRPCRSDDCVGNASILSFYFVVIVAVFVFLVLHRNAILCCSFQKRSQLTCSIHATLP